MANARIKRKSIANARKLLFPPLRSEIKQERGDLKCQTDAVAILIAICPRRTSRYQFRSTHFFPLVFWDTVSILVTTVRKRRFGTDVKIAERWEWGENFYLICLLLSEWFVASSRLNEEELNLS